MEKGMVKHLIGLHGFASCGKSTVMRYFIKWLIAECQWILNGVYNCETGETCKVEECFDCAAVLTRKGITIIVFTEGDFTTDPQRVEKLCDEISITMNVKISVVIAAMRVGYPNIVYRYSDWASVNNIEMVTILKRKLPMADEKYEKSVASKIAMELDFALGGKK